MKKCTSCGAEKALSEFHKCARWADGLQKQCKSCHKQLNKKHYKANAAAYIERATSTRSEALELTRFIKEEGSCLMCGISEWWRLAFHHLDASSKETTIANVRSLPQLLKELPKCILVCHNCHADIHHKERTGQ